MNGKGSKRRPTNEKKFADNWELAFGKKNLARYIPVRKLRKGKAAYC